MSMHKKPLTDLEREGLRLHGLDIGTPSQLSDCFRHGVKWALDSVIALQAERDALAAQLAALNKLHSDLTNADMVLDDGEHSGYLITSEQLEDMEHYLCEPILCMAAHDAEVAKRAVMSALRMYGDTDLSNKEIIALAENYAASLSK